MPNMISSIRPIFKYFKNMLLSTFERKTSMLKVLKVVKNKNLHVKEIDFKLK
jgi:hypothetical protein